MTESEIVSIITQLKNISGSDYDANKRMLDLICNGFTFRREDKTQEDLFIQLIDFEEPERNFFEIVNQVEIQGREQLRIPDGIVYVNGLPLVVLEFKSAIKENTTIEDAYKQLTIRYRRDIPELFKEFCERCTPSSYSQYWGSCPRLHLVIRWLALTKTNARAF